MPDPEQITVDKLVIHMYRLGTGDCFVLKFMKGDEVSFKMLIDCGCWSSGRSFTEIRSFIKELKKDVDNEVDVLVVTHEHLDHVRGFEAGKALFSNGFKVKRIWMAWTERDSDSKVEQWKQDHGQKKRALGLAAEQLKKSVGSRAFQDQLLGSRDGEKILGFRQSFAAVLEDFAALHVDGDYTGSLKGMAVVKEDLAQAGLANVEYFEPGDIIDNRAGLEGVRVFVLGPPKLYEEVKQESGGAEESYQHNKDLKESDLFVRAMNARFTAAPAAALEPFARTYSESFDAAKQSGARSAKTEKLYSRKEDDWRRIDDDWLFSAGQFALRMNSLTNNLSLVLAFEVVGSGKVVLFPGDAEFGSWSSWHRIDWEPKVPGLTTENLLNRVVFYKVAHHLSHNGTARSIGLEMMTSPDLAAMATLDYDVISQGWKSTMPNRLIVKELLERTKGRTIIMNPDPLFYDKHDEVPLNGKIEEHRQRLTPEERAAFDTDFDDSSEFYSEYVVHL
jgi:hypothetical protein